MVVQNLKEGWHLDKRVNVSIITVVIFQLIGFTWYISGLENRVNSNTENISRIIVQQEALRTQGTSQGNQLARIETEIIGLRRDIQRTNSSIETSLNQLIEFLNEQ